MVNYNITSTCILFLFRWRTSNNFLVVCNFSVISRLDCLPLVAILSHTLHFLHWSWITVFLSFSSPFCLSFLSFSLSPCLSFTGVVLVAGVLPILTATALTSMTFFSCLVRHQTPALGEATLPHRRRAVAKLCTGTAQEYSRTVKGGRWKRGVRRKRKGEAETIGQGREKRLKYCDLNIMYVCWNFIMHQPKSLDVQQLRK